MLFEFIDSEISRVEAADGHLHIYFAAAMVRTGANASATAVACSLGGQATRAYVRNLAIHCTQAVVTGDVAACIGTLSDGTVTLASQRHTSLPVPNHINSAVQLRLQCANGAWLQADAAALTCQLEGDAQWVDVLQC